MQQLICVTTWHFVLIAIYQDNKFAVKRVPLGVF